MSKQRMWKTVGALLRQARGSRLPRRVPVVLQMSPLDCGAACLAMILTYHGRKTSASECRDDCGAGRDGATALAIVEGGRRLGLRAKGYSVALADFGKVALPAIVHWNFNHFMVVERWSPTRVDVVDPSTGRVSLTTEEFDAGFTGVALTFEPGPAFQRGSGAPQLTRRKYLEYALRNRGASGLFTQALLASLVLQLLGLVLPLFTKVLIDDVLPFRATDVMLVLGLGMGLWILSAAIGNYLRSSVLIRLQTRLDSEMVVEFVEHILSLPFRFFQQRTTGDLLMRVSSNVTLRDIFTTETLSAVLDGGLVVCYLAILLLWQPTMGLAALLIGLLQVAVLVATAPAMHRFMRRDLRAQSDAQSYMVEALSGIATLKSSGAEERALERWTDLYFKQLSVSMQRGHLSALTDSVMSALRMSSPLILLWMGTRYVMSGQLSVGSMLAFTALAASFLAPLASLVANSQRLQLAGAHLERIADVLGAEREQVLEGRHPGFEGPPGVQLKNVSFKYDPAAAYVLRNISLEIAPGQKVAIAGRTGSGKSTLAKLIVGLYMPTEGDISINGISLADLNLRHLRKDVGIVLQEPFLFSGSIRENLSFNDPSLPLERIVEAARLAGIHDEIASMPMAYETIIAEGGSVLSGGQRQRLALARALTRHPPLLLLDEATSHLDTVTETLINRNLDQLSCTRVIIAHRLSTVRHADLIVVMDDGRVVEQGTHQELIARRGRYADLAQSQMSTESEPC